MKLGLIVLICCTFFSLISAKSEVSPFNAQTEQLTAFDNAHLLTLGGIFFFTFPFTIAWIMRYQSEKELDYFFKVLPNETLVMLSKFILSVLPYFVGLTYAALFYVDGLGGGFAVDRSALILLLWAIGYLIYMHTRAVWPSFIYCSSKHNTWKFWTGAILHIIGVVFHALIILDVILGHIWNTPQTHFPGTNLGFLITYYVLAALTLLSELVLWVLNLVFYMNWFDVQRYGSRFMGRREEEEERK